MKQLENLKIKDLKPGDYVRSRFTSKIHKVTYVDTYYGCFQATGPGGRNRNYRINPNGSQQFVKLSLEEKADLLLSLENHGITDYWRED